MSCSGMSDEALGCVMQYLQDPKDRASVSLVCRAWYEVDALTRKKITISMCYTTSPDRVWRRFKNLESLKIKGKPRAAMFNLIPEDWGGYVTPWVTEIVKSFNTLKSVHFRRMIVKDSDLELLAKSRGRILQVLKLDFCSGFSTDGLFYLARFCRKLTTLFLEESSIDDKDGEWLHEIAMNNKVLENLNFYSTDLYKIRFQDLELIAKNCLSLVSVKISDSDIFDLIGFFKAASALEEFCGGSVNNNNNEEEVANKYCGVTLPPKLCRLGLTYMGINEMPIVFPLASSLKKLDLLYALLDTEGHCLLIQKCCNLQVLKTRNVIGDRGLEVVASSCKKLKRLRIERGDDDQQGMDQDIEEATVSQRGLIALANGCLQLEFLAVYVSDITNAALQHIGATLKNLNDFRLVLLNKLDKVTDLPLDNGVRSLLRHCDKLQRFSLYLRPGGLTDVGLGYIGQYGLNVRFMLLGFVGESDEGILALSKGCPNLQKLEMRGSFFTENGLARAVLQLNSLRYFNIQGYLASQVPGRDLLAMARPFWNVELISATNQQPARILAYYSLAGIRTDFPTTVVPLYPMRFVDA